MDRKVSVIEDLDGNEIVVIHDIRFKGKRMINWVEVATSKSYTQNFKEKHNNDAKYGWYRYESRFALPVFDETGEVIRYNVFHVIIVVRHGRDGKMYLYDIMNIKKETSTLFQSEDITQ